MPDFWEGQTGPNMEVYPFSHGLSREFFLFVPDILEHPPPPFTFMTKFTSSNLKKNQKVRKAVFLDKFRTVSTFVTISLSICLGLSSKSYTLSHPVVIENGLAKISFSKLILIESHAGKLFGGSPPPLPGIRRVNISD